MKSRRAEGPDDLTVDKLIAQLEQEKFEKHRDALDSLAKTQEIPLMEGGS